MDKEEVNRCKKCGEEISEKKLRCKDCIKYVDSEIKGETNQPFSFYFKYYQKGKSNVRIAEKR